MKYRFLFWILLVLVFGSSNAQVTVNDAFVHGGINRTYSYYIPASYNPAHPVPLVIGLHGLGSDGTAFGQYRDFKPIADTANFIVVNPDGSTMFGIRFWNYGSVMGSTVDDVGFLEALIDTLSAEYSIDQQHVYCAGMSNGAFMAYYLACESDRFAAIGSVTGSMSVDMYDNCSPSRPTPSIHIHGTEDNVNPYEGTSSMVGIEVMNRFWVDLNECDTVPLVFPVPDIDTDDEATATRYLYAGGTDGHTVELFKVTGGEHSWPGHPMPGSSDITCMDFNASAEIWRFFSQYELNGVSSVKEKTQIALSVWPNPTHGLVHLETSGTIDRVTVFDLQGRALENLTQHNLRSIDMGHLGAGNYVLRISGNGFDTVKKLVVLP